MLQQHESFETPGHVLLSLRIPVGELALETYEGSQTEIDLRLHGEDDDARALLDATRVELRERGEGRWEVFVEVPKPRGFGFFRREPEIELRVRAPHGAGVQARTRSADVEARGRYGAVELETVSGDVRFDEIGEAAALKTTSGDLRVDRTHGSVDLNSTSGDIELELATADVSAKTVSGDVRIRNAAGSVQITSVSGDQSVEAVTDGRVELQAVSGDITVGIRRGSRLWVDARSLSGDTSSELELELDPGDDDGPLVELRANTVSGDIRVVRAAAPVH